MSSAHEQDGDSYAGHLITAERRVIGSPSSPRAAGHRAARAFDADAFAFLHRADSVRTAE
ncbi:hypothetical protein [Roseibium sp.]|uniref:hypothetical protein n=1 Tax=Roseibium sp. TaxID=1936156 RepID=UPI00329A2E29